MYLVHVDRIFLFFKSHVFNHDTAAMVITWVLLKFESINDYLTILSMSVVVNINNVHNYIIIACSQANTNSYTLQL